MVHCVLVLVNCIAVHTLVVEAVNSCCYTVQQYFVLCVKVSQNGILKTTFILVFLY